LYFGFWRFTPAPVNIQKSELYRPENEQLLYVTFTIAVVAVGATSVAG
jgi:hypothetical protein